MEIIYKDMITNFNNFINEDLTNDFRILFNKSKYDVIVYRVNNENDFDKLKEVLVKYPFFNFDKRNYIQNKDYYICLRTNGCGVFEQFKVLTGNSNSFVIEMTEERKSKEDIINMLRSQKYVRNWIFDCYKKHVEQKDFQRFIKYVYLYLQEL